MITLWAALPGGGKTYRAMRFIERDLVTSKKWIVTNLTEIKLPEFQAYLFKKYPHLGEQVDLTRRLRIIKKIDSRRFYVFRGCHEMEDPPKAVFEKTTGAAEKDRLLEAYFLLEAEKQKAGAMGVTYYLDEAHRHFSAEEWSEVGPVLKFYATQHRHLDDNVFFMTQSAEFIIVTFRRLCEEAWALINGYRQTFSLWKRPGKFTARGYYRVADMIAQRNKFDEQEYTLDLALANCYVTRGALGGAELPPDTKPVSKKLPFWTIWAFAAAAVALVMAATYYLPQMAGGYLNHFMGGITGRVDAKKETAPPAETAKASAPMPGTRADQGTRPNRQGTADPVNVGPLVHVKSTMRRGSAYRVELTDGRVFTEATGGVNGFARGLVRLDTGEVLAYARPSEGTPASRGRSLLGGYPVQGSSGAALAGSGIDGAGNTHTRLDPAERVEEKGPQISKPAPSKQSETVTHELPMDVRTPSHSNVSTRNAVSPRSPPRKITGTVGGLTIHRRPAADASGTP